MATKPTCWTVNTRGEVWIFDQQGGGTLMSPKGKPFAFNITVNWIGDAWIVSAKARKGGAAIMGRLISEDGWHELPPPAAATKIAVGHGLLWTVNSSQEVWSIEPAGGNTQVSPSGFAHDICVGLDGSIWAVSTEVSQGGNTLKVYDEGTKEWKSLPTPANATRIAVGLGGELYSVNVIGEVWLRQPKGGHVHISPPGVDFADEISIGRDGTVWITGKELVEGGNNLMWWSGKKDIWHTVPGPAAAVKIAGSIE